MHTTDEDANRLMKQVEERLAERKGSVRNWAASGALLKAIPMFGDALHHSLTAGNEAEAKERQRIQLDLMAELLIRIDNALSEVADLARQSGMEVAEIGGTIRLRAVEGETVTGVHIEDGAGPTRFQQGTEIDVQTDNVRHVTGLKIGGKSQED